MKRNKEKKEFLVNNYSRQWPPKISEKKLEFYLERKKKLEEKFGKDEKIPLEERKKPVNDIQLLSTHILLKRVKLREKQNQLIDNFLNKQTEINHTL